MSISSEITRLQGAKASIKTSIENKGVSVSSSAKLDDYDEYIDQISGGGGTEYKIKFVDYGGEPLYSYTLEEIAELTELPALPTGPTGWTAMSWTETLVFLKGLSDLERDYYVGVNYDTNYYQYAEIDGVVSSDDLTLYLYSSNSSSQSHMTIDWGDGIIDDFGFSSSQWNSHTYLNPGSYTVKISSNGTQLNLASNTYGLPGWISSSSMSCPCIGFLRDFLVNKSTSETLHVSSFITEVRLGKYVTLYDMNRPYAISSNRESKVLIPYNYRSNMNSWGTYYWKQIDYSSFSTMIGLKHITIPSSIVRINESTFANCSNLQSITIPSSVTSIGSNAFESCRDLQSITIPSGVTSIGERTFSYCSSLQSVTIPSSVTSIGNYAFQSCYGLQSLTIPSSVTSIGNYAFQFCYGLQSITIPSGVTSIGDYAFANCQSLQSLTIPSSVTSIGENAFAVCSSLQSITIPSGVTSIKYSLFGGCYNLQSVTIPSSVTSIGNYAFATCQNLQSITIPSSVTSIGSYAFSYCSSLQSVTIPSSVTSIADGVFYNCYALQSITIPSSVTSIGNSVFYNCFSLQSITIPSSVTSIAGGAFSRCSWLNEVHIEATIPPTLGSGVFDSNYSTRKIYVPYSADHSVLAAYQSATNWSNYASKMVEMPEPQS